MHHTQVLRALADERRLQIVELLLAHNYCVRALARKLGVSEAAVSQHLKVLREAGLLVGEKRGYYMHYDVDRQLLRALADEIAQLAALERQAASLERELERLVDSLAIAPDSARARIFARMERMEGEKADLEVDIAKMRVASGIHWTREQILAWLQQFGAGDPMDAGFRRKIIDTFVNAAYFYDDRVVIFYNVRGGKQVSYTEMLETTENPGADDLPQGSDLDASGVPDRIRTCDPQSRSLILYPTELRTHMQRWIV